MWIAWNLQLRNKAYFMQNMNIRATKQNGENQLRLTFRIPESKHRGKNSNITHLPASISEYYAEICAVF